MLNYDNVEDLPERYRNQAEKILKSALSFSRFKADEVANQAISQFNAENRCTAESATKFGNKKAMSADGILFDSRKELRRWEILTRLEELGVITELQRQVKFELIPAQRDESGKVVERACSYIADFSYIEDGKHIVEDTKGFKTKDYIIKRKLMRYLLGIEVHEI